ncbi:Coenzyme A disulfide reductase [Polystyrenella longa]|uniref:Coenzyme A disulfide reductase n=1 Tax=Polystyrenella longa TaxID=2528007 RepID=A0A518CKC7_9PLAN|nr:FAD-dependent oxidoreductase [Polystyrenella longa]QDU79679.1 Coenzyme A disulfide reductase [Polystyrenella longa]
MNNSKSASTAKRTIVIVGGVAGGASAAARARRCNEAADIIMFEKDRYVSFANCGLPYHIGGEIDERDKLLVATPELFEKRFRIDARTRHEVLSIDQEAKSVQVKNLESGEEFAQDYDRLILSPGASPIIPPIEGSKAKNVFSLRNIEDMDRINQGLSSESSTRDVKQAVVVGAGFIGLEMVEQLHRLGIKVSLVELAPQVLPPLDREMARLIEEELERHEIQLHLGDGIQGLKVEGDRAVGVTLDSGMTIDTDLVIMCIGVKPNTQLAKQAGLEIGETGGIKINEYLQTSDPNIYAVGDAVEYEHAILEKSMRVALAGPANRAGRIAGEHAATDQSPSMAAVMGTAIVRVFDLGAALTGLSEKMAAKFNRRAKSVIVQAGHHSGYFPGAKTITLKLIYEPETGVVLGAQAIGAAGIDKRIDVIATAMKFKATVEDLTELDLSYAPPYGSAKDPVHLAAFTAQNDLRGFAPIVAYDADLAGKQIVDVRTLKEQEKLPPVPGAYQIEVDELREHLDELDPEQPTVVICHSAKRAHVGTRILLGHGFKEVSNLTGGMSIRRLMEN